MVQCNHKNVRGTTGNEGVCEDCGKNVIRFWTPKRSKSGRPGRSGWTIFSKEAGGEMKKEATQNRGQLTERIKQRSKELLGYEVGQTELRMFPYILYVMMMTNKQRVDPNKVNGEERKILSKWREAGHIEGGASGLRITEEFWNVICDIVFLGYVDID